MVGRYGQIIETKVTVKSVTIKKNGNIYFRIYTAMSTEDYALTFERYTARSVFFTQKNREVGYRMSRQQLLNIVDSEADEILHNTQADKEV